MEKNITNLLAGLDDSNFNTKYIVLEEYFKSFGDVPSYKLFFKVLDRTLENEDELNLNSKNLLKLHTLRNKIKTRVIEFHTVETQQHLYHELNNVNIGRKTFTKRSLKNVIFKCKIKEKDVDAVLKIKNFMKGSSQNEHCCYYSELTVEGTNFHVLAKFEHEDIPVYPHNSNKLRTKRRYKFMSEAKVKSLEENHSDFISYTQKIMEPDDSIDFNDKKYYNIQACGRIILEVIDDDINFYPSIKNYIWLERIIDNFKHFWSTTYCDKPRILVSVNDPFLLELQKKIYFLSNYICSNANSRGVNSRESFMFFGHNSGP